MPKIAVASADGVLYIFEKRKVLPQKKKPKSPQFVITLKLTKNDDQINLTHGNCEAPESIPLEVTKIFILESGSRNWDM